MTMNDDEPLDGREILAVRPLEELDGRGAPGPAGGSVSRVRCGRPLAYPVPPEDLPPLLRRRAGTSTGRYAGVFLAFDLDVLPAGQRYTGARFEATLTAPGARAVQLAADGDELGLVQGEPASAVALRTVGAARPGLLRRLGRRTGAPRAWTTGLQSPTFGWVYDDPRSTALLPRTYGMHAVVELPPSTTELAGVLTVQAEVDGDRLLTASAEFREPFTAAEVPAGAAVRLCLAADVVGYSRRGNVSAEEVQHDLVRVLAQARAAAGIAESAVRPQPQGDGQFTVLPVGVDESVVIPRLIGRLRAALLDRDRERPEGERMRLRVAFHRGLVKEAANGWVGGVAVAVHRILDSGPLRQAIKENPEAPYVLGLPDVLFHDVIAHAVEPPLPADFRPMTVELPEKAFVEQGWLTIGAGR